jgi:hypothetical protein
MAIGVYSGPIEVQRSFAYPYLEKVLKRLFGTDFLLAIISLLYLRIIEHLTLSNFLISNFLSVY